MTGIVERCSDILSDGCWFMVGNGTEEFKCFFDVFFAVECDDEFFSGTHSFAVHPFEIFFLDVCAVGEQYSTQVGGCRCGVDFFIKTVADEFWEESGVVDVGVCKENGINGVWVEQKV